MAASCDRLQALRARDTQSDASAARPEPSERISVGDRALVIDVRSRSWSEGVLASGGRLPGFQRPGLKRSIRVTVSGSVGSSALQELAIVTSIQAWDRDLSPDARAAMDAGNAVIERCADPAMPGRVAFRAKSRSGAALRGSSLRWIGAFLLPNTVSIVRQTVTAERCEDALAALPREPEAWVRGELEATLVEMRGGAPVESVVRRDRVAVRDLSLDFIANEAPRGPRSANAAGIVATTEGIALASALEWALASSDALPLSVYTKLGAALGRGEALSRRALDAIEPTNSTFSLGSMRAPIVTLILGAERTVAAERVPSLASHLAAACSDAARARTTCTPTRVEAIARLAARSEHRAACTTIANAIEAMGTTLESGEARGLSRLLALRAVHRCAEPAATRAASLALFRGPYDYVSGSGLDQTCLSSDADDRERCMDPALFAAIRLRESCGDDVTRAAITAASAANGSLQQSAVLCVAMACGGARAARRAFDALPEGAVRAWRAPPERACWTSDEGGRDGSTRATTVALDESVRDAGPADR